MKYANILIKIANFTLILVNLSLFLAKSLIFNALSTPCKQGVSKANQRSKIDKIVQIMINIAQIIKILDK